MENKRKLIVVISVCIAILICIAFLAFYLYQINPSTKIKKSLTQEIGILKNSISNLNSSTYNSLLTAQNKNKNKKTNLKPLNTNTHLVFNLNLSNEFSKNNKLSIIKDILNNSDIELITNVDLENKYIDSKISSKYDSTRLNANIYIDNSNIYLKFKDISDKYIALNDTNNKTFNSILEFVNSGVTLKELNYLLDVISKTIKDTKISDKIVSTSENIKIGETVYETKKDVLTIDNQLCIRFGKNLLKQVSKDESSLKIIKKVLEVEELTDVQKKISEVYTALSNGSITILKDNQKLELSTYMTGIFPKFLMQTLDYKLNANLEGSIALIRATIDGFSNHIIFTEGGTKITCNTKNKNNDYNIQVVIEGISKDELVINIEGLLSPKKVDAKYDIARSDEQLVSGDIKYSQSFDSSKKNSSFEFKYDAQNINYGNGSVILNSNIKQISSVKKQEINESINYKDFSLNDTLIMKAKLIKKLPVLSRILISGE